MKKHLHLLVILIVAVFALAACGTPTYDSNQHTGDETHEETDAAAMDAADTEAMAEDADTAQAEAAAGEGQAAEAGAEETTDYAPDMPAETGDAAPVGDPAAGEELFNTLYSEVGFACATCHRVDSEEMLIGPGLLNVSIRGPQNAGLGQSAVEYIHQSIVEPGAFVVEGYPENLMPQTYSEIFTEAQINDIIAYVMTLHD